MEDKNPTEEGLAALHTVLERAGHDLSLGLEPRERDDPETATTITRVQGSHSGFHLCPTISAF